MAWGWCQEAARTRPGAETLSSETAAQLRKWLSKDAEQESWRDLENAFKETGCGGMGENKRD